MPRLWLLPSWLPYSTYLDWDFHLPLLLSPGQMLISQGLLSATSLRSVQLSMLALIFQLEDNVAGMHFLLLLIVGGWDPSGKQYWVHEDQLSHDWLMLAGMGHGDGNPCNFKQSSVFSKSPSGVVLPPCLPGMNFLDLVRVAPGPHVREQALQLVQLVHFAATVILGIKWL